MVIQNLGGFVIFKKSNGRHGIKFGGDYRHYIWPMWGFFQNRGYYQYTNGYTTQYGFNDGSGSGLASLLLSLPAVKQRQAGVPEMNLRNWGYDLFAEDSWQVTSTTTTSTSSTTTQPQVTLIEKVIFKSPLELTFDAVEKVLDIIIFWD